MCGVCGIYHYRAGAPADERLLAAMTAAMTHRGPDDEGFHADGPVGLGVRRLSIIDLEGGAQPIRNEDGTLTVVQNGEIYNYRELRRELEGHGHVFRTRSDTETIIHAYEQWGVEGLARLNGMYGLALWDDVRKRLVVARDPFGVKPLYYWDDGTTLLFGSEIRAILCAPEVRREVDLSALEEYVALTYVAAPRTAFQGIGKLLPGHALVYDANGGSMQRFHSMIPDQRTSSTDDEVVLELRDAIAEAVRRQMVADVPVGAMLSGGIDSATVAAIMTEVAEAPIDTFTVGFGSDFAEDELEAARATARRIGSRHHEVVISAHEYADFLPESIRHLEEPVATTSTLAFHRVSALAREHVKVVLTGQGADEAFAGYPRYLGERYGHLYRALPRGVRERVVVPLVDRLPRNERLKRAVRSLGTQGVADRMRRVHQVVDDRYLAALLLREPSRNGRGDGFAVWEGDVAGLAGVDAMTYVDARTSLADNLLLYGDKMSMAVSLEARVPFLDVELMRLVESLPARLKIDRLTQKAILKRAITPWVPREVIARKKIGFATPVDAWLRGVLRGQVEERLLSEGSACRTYFRAETIRRMLEEHAEGRHDHKRILFALLTFEIWYEQFIAPPRWQPATDSRSSRTTSG